VSSSWSKTGLLPFNPALVLEKTQAKAAEDVSTRWAHKRVFEQSLCLLGLAFGNEKASSYHQQDCRQEEEDDDQKA
jgi:hypothetical protein